MVKNLKDFQVVVAREMSNLEHVREYITEAGEARLEALKSIYFYSQFVDTLAELMEFDEYLDLVNIGGKHPEYYKTVRFYTRNVNRILGNTI